MGSELNEWLGEREKMEEQERENESAERWKLNFDNLTSIGAL